MRLLLKTMSVVVQMFHCICSKSKVSSWQRPNKFEAAWLVFFFTNIINFLIPAIFFQKLSWTRINRNKILGIIGFRDTGDTWDARNTGSIICEGRNGVLFMKSLGLMSNGIPRFQITISQWAIILSS